MTAVRSERPRRVLVTGASGFVGANLARRLCAEGHSVTAAVRPGADLWRLEPPGPGLEALDVHRLDVADERAVADLVAQARPEWTFHLAAHGAYSWQTDARRTLSVNLIGTVNLVEACGNAGCEVLVHAGSSSEYGFKDHAPDEEEALAPNGEYAVAKAAATLYCRQAGASGSMRVVTLRLYSVYGPFEDPRRLLPKLVAKGLQGELPPLVSPEVAHDFVAVQDAVEAFLLAARHPAPAAVYNVGSGRQTELREVVDIARRTLGIEARPQWGSAPERRWDTSTWVAKTDRIRAELGWRPEIALDDGVALMAQWLRSSPTVAPLYGQGPPQPLEARS